AGRNEDKISAAVAELAPLGQAFGVTADVTDPDQVRRMVAQTVEHFGGLDIMFANAGMNIRKPPKGYSSDEWHTIVDTNLTGVFACSQAAYPALVERGSG